MQRGKDQGPGMAPDPAEVSFGQMAEEMNMLTEPKVLRDGENLAHALVFVAGQNQVPGFIGVEFAIMPESAQQHFVIFVFPGVRRIKEVRRRHRRGLLVGPAGETAMDGNVGAEHAFDGHGEMVVQAAGGILGVALEPVGDPHEIFEDGFPLRIDLRCEGGGKIPMQNIHDMRKDRNPGAGKLRWPERGIQGVGLNLHQQIQRGGREDPFAGSRGERHDQGFGFRMSDTDHFILWPGQRAHIGV